MTQLPSSEDLGVSAYSEPIYSADRWLVGWIRSSGRYLDLSRVHVLHAPESENVLRVERRIAVVLPEIICLKPLNSKRKISDLVTIVRGAQDTCKPLSLKGTLCPLLVQLLVNRTLSYLHLLKWFPYWPIDFKLILWKSCCLIRWLPSTWQSCFSLITSAGAGREEAAISSKRPLHRQSIKSRDSPSLRPWDRTHGHLIN